MIDLLRIYEIHRQCEFSDKDIKKAFDRQCKPLNVIELISAFKSQELELEDLRAYKALAIELANRKGFDSVAGAIDSIGEERKESQVVYNLLCEVWPRNNKPLSQVISERIEQCTRAE